MEDVGGLTAHPQSHFSLNLTFHVYSSNISGRIGLTGTLRRYDPLSECGVPIKQLQLLRCVQTT